LFSGGKEKDYLFKNIVKCQDILFIFFFFPDRHFVISNRLFRRDEWCGMVAHAESDAKRRPEQQPTDWLLRNNGNVIVKKTNERTTLYNVMQQVNFASPIFGSLISSLMLFFCVSNNFWNVVKSNGGGRGNWIMFGPIRRFIDCCCAGNLML
jgi:hypothetical protein